MKITLIDEDLDSPEDNPKPVKKDTPPKKKSSGGGVVILVFIALAVATFFAIGAFRKAKSETA